MPISSPGGDPETVRRETRTATDTAMTPLQQHMRRYVGKSIQSEASKVVSVRPHEVVVDRLVDINAKLGVQLAHLT